MIENRFSKSGQITARPDVSNGDAPVNEGLETLRLLVELPPPQGLEDRVFARLTRELDKPKVRGFWSLWKPVHSLQYAGAAVLMVIIGATSWTVLHERASYDPGSPVQPASPAMPAKSFGTSSSKSYPTTVKPIKVPAAPKKKPGAGHAAKSSPKPSAPASQ